MRAAPGSSRVTAEGFCVPSRATAGGTASWGVATGCAAASALPVGASFIWAGASAPLQAHSSRSHAVNASLIAALVDTESKDGAKFERRARHPLSPLAFMPSKTASDAESDSLIGKVFADRYLIQTKLGEGGMGSV